MRVTIHGWGESRTLHSQPSPGLPRDPVQGGAWSPIQGRTLGALLGTQADAVDLVTWDGTLCPQWQERPLEPESRIELWLKPGIPAALVVPLLLSLAVSLVTFGITYGLGLLLQNRPDPTKQQRPEETFGIAGLSNTTSIGTPKFITYGVRRVFGHFIGSLVEVLDKTMRFGALYFMGEGPVERISQIEINDTALAHYPETSFEWRSGTALQTAITGFDVPRQVYQDGRAIARQTGIVYQSRSALVSHLRLTLSIPYLQHTLTSETSSRTEPGRIRMRVEFKTVENPTWIAYPLPGGAPYWEIEDLRRGAFFQELVLGFGSPQQWQVRLTLIGLVNDQHAVPSLFNVEEDQERRADGSRNTQTYPHNALLAIFGVASEQITSFENLKVSAVVRGKTTAQWNGAVWSWGYSRARVWAVVDMLTNQRTGMGHRLPLALIDRSAALSAQTYYNAEIDGQIRDRCDALINQRRPVWDWVKDTLLEGQAGLFMSMGLLKYVVERARTPQIAYTTPGRIVLGSLVQTLGASGPLINTVRGEYLDQAKNYRLQIVELTAADIGTEPVNETTVSLKTVTSAAMALRDMAYALKKHRLVPRRYTWDTPLGGLVSEPFDVTMLSFPPAGTTGFVQAESTVRTLLLDRLVALQAGQTYEVFVMQNRTNEVAQRTWIAAATGQVMQLEVAPDLPFVPVAGDLYMMGLLARTLQQVVVDHVAYNRETMTYTLSATAYTPDVYDTSGVGLVPQTATQFWDLPALYAEDTLPRYHASYEAEAPALTRVRLGAQAEEPVAPWPGAALWRSQDPDDTLYALASQGTPLPVQGVALSVLGSWETQVTDLQSAVDVQVTGGLLSSITAAEMQMGFNHLLVGGELLQFRVATLLAPGQYRLREFRRGRRGTEWAWTAHSAGEACVLLGTGVLVRDMLLSERQRQRNWKSPTIGQDIVEVTAQPYAVPSHNLRPWTVGSPRARRQSTGTWIFGWRGRARWLGDWVDLTEAVPDDDVLYYLLTIYLEATRAQIVHQVELFQTNDYQALQQYQYPASQQQADFGSVQDTLYFDIQQVGTDDVSRPMHLVAVAGEGT